IVSVKLPADPIMCQNPMPVYPGATNASIAAMITGKYSGFAPAITALIAIFSIVAVPDFIGILPITSLGERLVPLSILATVSLVGGTRGNPSPILFSRNDTL